MLTKEEFVKLVDRVKVFQDYVDNCYKIGLNLYDVNGDPVSGLVDDYIKLISKLMNDPEQKHVGTNLEYFIYETNFGEDADRCFTRIEDKEYHFYTAEDVYDFLVKFYNSDQSDNSPKNPEHVYPYISLKMQNKRL